MMSKQSEEMIQKQLDDIKEKVDIAFSMIQKNHMSPTIKEIEKTIGNETVTTTVGCDIYPDGFAHYDDAINGVINMDCPYAEERTMIGVAIPPLDYKGLCPMVGVRFNMDGPWYSSGIKKDGTTKFSPIPHSMPMIVGNEAKPLGVYMPFTTSADGAKLVMKICEQIIGDDTT